MPMPDRAPQLNAPSPAVLWHQANEEHPDDEVTRRERYLDLMREHGHIVQRESDDDRPLFSCGYQPTTDREDHR